MLNSIGSRFAVMAIMLVLLTATIVAGVQYHQHTKNETQREVDRLTFAAERSVRILQQTVDDMQRKVLFLASTPPIQGIIRAEKNAGIDPLDGSSITTWEDRLAQIFLSLAQTNPSIFQVRFIQKSNGGHELVRINRENGVVFRTNNAMLQEKIDRYYVRETLEAPAHARRRIGGAVVLGEAFVKLKIAVSV